MITARVLARLDSLRGPLLVAALCVVPLVLWARSAPLDDRFANRYTTLTSIAVLLAFAGTAAFALNLALGARLRPVEAVFGGLERMYGAHRAIGKIAFALLLGHVVLILASRATISSKAALDLLQPAAGWTVFAGVLALAAMTVSILLTLFVRLGHEVFVYVQRGFGFAFIGASYHVFTTSGAKDDSQALNTYMVVLASVGIGAFAYRSLFGNLLVRRRRYRVTEANRLDESVTEIVMEPVGKPLEFGPGQFVFVSFRSPAFRKQLRPVEISLQRQVFSIRAGEIANQFHPFSITSAPGERQLRITVKAVGDYTRALRMLDAGAEAVVEGPYGSFSHRRADSGRQIWMAGGIGVTPFLSMARSLDNGQAPSVDFYYCVEHEAEAHFLDELRAVAGVRDDFRVVLVSRDRDGFLTAARVIEEAGDLSSASVLICGPPAMIDSLRSQLEAAAVPRGQIHAEEFAFAKLGQSGSTDPGGVDTAQRWSDRQVLAFLAALVFAGIAVATGIVVWDEVL
jgi:predicted ferric reductase